MGLSVEAPGAYAEQVVVEESLMLPAPNALPPDVSMLTEPMRLTALGGFAPAMLLALAGRVGSRTPQRAVQTVTTNVPGPQQPLYLCGRRMLEAFPFVPLGSSVRVGLAIFSYDGSINFGVSGDRDSAPDIGVLCRGIEDSMAELLGTPSGPSDRKRPARSQRRSPAASTAADGGRVEREAPR